MRHSSYIICAVAILMAVATGCTSVDPAYDHPAAKITEEVLQLRRDDVRDAEAYLPYFENAELARAFSYGSEAEPGTPRVPEWEPPYVSEETSDTADVVVVWKPGHDFPDWPAVNIFKTRLTDGHWVLVDAVEATSAPEPIAEQYSR
ncbi:MAG: hypothetical protein JXA36_02875 [Coriobacteriia bacterium]|nr:hypothetical protein [Coriobacteriia bacterium]